jgi:DNA (cytosine-5)-methyltransferase 1
MSDLSPTLREGGHGQSHANSGVVPAIAFALRGRDDGAQVEVSGDRVGALRAGSGGSSRDYVAEPIAFTTEQTPKFSPDTALTLTKQSPTGGGQIQSVMSYGGVRRLTPVECERLQGFPDDYTAETAFRSRISADGPRYKALGNSMAVPVMRWIMGRIKQNYQAVMAEREAS